MEYNNLNFGTDDLLQRKQFVINLMQVVTQWNELKHESNSLVISIDSPWGTGKSYLLNMWRNWLLSSENSSENYAVTYYNAWENDDCDNAFIPLVYKLQQMDVYKENIELIESVKAKTESFLKSCGIALLKDGIKKAIGNETADLFCNIVDDTAKATAKTENFFKHYQKYVDEKEKFEDSLINLVPDNGKLIVFVDELDRCRPTFAIETLEIIKHYFKIKNIVFVFAVDLEQLSHSIETMYGDGMDSAGYLRRFFDFNISIPSADIKEYTNYLLKDFADKMLYAENFIDMVANIYIKLKLSLRDINKITNNFMVFCMFYQDDIEQTTEKKSDKVADALEVYLYFMTLKYKYPTIYNRIIRQEFISYNNQPKNWDVLEMKYYISPGIRIILDDMQTGRAQDKNGELINKYGLTRVNDNGLSFAEHIERTIEMFS